MEEKNGGKVKRVKTGFNRRLFVRRGAANVKNKRDARTALIGAADRIGRHSARERMATRHPGLQSLSRGTPLAAQCCSWEEKGEQSLFSRRCWWRCRRRRWRRRSRQVGRVGRGASEKICKWSDWRQRRAERNSAEGAERGDETWRQDDWYFAGLLFSCGCSLSSCGSVREFCGSPFDSGTPPPPPLGWNERLTVFLCGLRQKFCVRKIIVDPCSPFLFTLVRMHYD